MEGDGIVSVDVDPQHGTSYNSAIWEHRRPCHSGSVDVGHFGHATGWGSGWSTRPGVDGGADVESGRSLAPRGFAGALRGVRVTSELMTLVVW